MVWGEMELFCVMLEEVVESRRRAREGEANAVARVKVLEEMFVCERELYECVVEEMCVELVFVWLSVEIVV